MTFQMWSPFHYLMMFFPFVLIIILFIIFHKKNQQSQQLVAIVLSILMVIIIIAREIYMIYAKGELNPEAFPFQICHFANFMLLIASFKKAKVFGTIAWCLNFPAALVSLIFANSLVNYDNILNIQGLAYIFGHMLIVAGGLYMVLVGIIQINKKSLIKMYEVVGGLYILSIFINNWFNKIFASTHVDANYFYTYKPEDGTPLQMFYDLGKNIQVLGLTFNPIYLLILLIFGSFILFIFYFIYRLISSFFTNEIRSI